MADTADVPKDKIRMGDVDVNVEILGLFREGYSVAQLVKIFECSRGTIEAVIREAVRSDA